MKTLRVLVVPFEYPDIDDDRLVNGCWAEEQVLAIKSRCEVQVLRPLQIPNGKAEIETVERNGIRVTLSRFLHRRKTWLFSYFIATWRGISSLRKNFDFDLIHAHGIRPAGLACVLYGKFCRVPVVVTEHWGRLEERSKQSTLERLSIKFVLRFATSMISVSEQLASEMRFLDPRSSPVIVPNVLSPVFIAAKIVRSEKKDQFDFLFVGSLNDNRKGLRELLDAFSNYSNSGDALDSRLSIVGDGVLKKDYEAYANELGIADCCSFWGNLSRNDVVKMMLECDIFVMPSTYETFGVVYIEALSCGKPVIACSNTPASEIVPDWGGVLVKPGSAEAIADAIKRVTTNFSSYDPVRLSTFAKTNYGDERFSELLLDLYIDTLYN